MAYCIIDCSLFVIAMIDFFLIKKFQCFTYALFSGFEPKRCLTSKLLCTTISSREERLLRRNRVQPVNMADTNPAARAAAAANPANVQLAQALIALTGVLTNLQNQGNTNRAPVTQDPFSSPNAFDLSSRSGESAFKIARESLDTTWDGTTANFPAFIVALRIRATEARWDATHETGILANLHLDYFRSTHLKL